MKVGVDLPETMDIRWEFAMADNTQTLFLDVKEYIPESFKPSILLPAHTRNVVSKSRHDPLCLALAA